LPKPWESITDPWDLLIVLSVLILVHHTGGKAVMNLKFLLQPTIERIREDLRPEIREEVRPEVREEVREEVQTEAREEERERNTRAMKSWLEEQIRAGKISEDVELPVFGDNGNGNGLPIEKGDQEE
jgi:hypothetical protein